MLKLAAALTIVFGALSLVSGGMVLFGPERVRAAMGVVLLPLLWFNFLMGAAYIVGGVGIWRAASWAGLAAWLIAGANSVACAGVYAYWLVGNPVEPRTLGAVAARAGVWLAVAVWLGRQRRA